LDPGSEIRDPGSGMGKNQDPGSGMNIRILFDLLSLKNYVNVPSKRNKKKFRKKVILAS
jgi:hypothetical protein